MSYFNKNLKNDPKEVEKPLDPIDEKTKKLEDHIEKIEKRYQILIQKSSDVFEIVKPDGTLKYISAAGENFTGEKATSRIGKKFYDFFYGRELDKVKKMLEQVLLEYNRREVEIIEYRSKQGRLYYLEIEMHNLLNEPVIEGIAVKTRDITKRRESELRLEYLSNHDLLTGLPNRRFFDGQLEDICRQAMMTGEKVGLLMFDINGLKYINYFLGYDMGDQLMLELVERLKLVVGDRGSLSRHLDDHFVVLMPGLDQLDDCERLAKDLCDQFMQPFMMDQYELNLSINIGISSFPKDAENAVNLKNKSQTALMRAKKEGKNTYSLYSSRMDIQSFKEFTLKSDIHKAIEKEELSIEYKPLVNASSKEIFAAEAKIIWNHPEWGPVSPHEFIYLAEESGKIIDIGKWALQEICKTYLDWQVNRMPKIKILLPFSNIQFLEADFVDHIDALLKLYNLDASFLMMEINQMIFKLEVEKISNDIQKLKELGVKIVLNNYGLDFLSLQNISRLNVDILKLDGEATTNLPVDPVKTTITRAIINLARELKMGMLVDNISSFKQLNFFLEQYCDLVAGELYSRALPRVEFEEVLSRKTIKPKTIDEGYKIEREERRKFFRIGFEQALEADATVLEINGKKANVGYTKALVENIGGGGLKFISNIKFPVMKNITLQFRMDLSNESLVLNGSPVWMSELGARIYEYGIEFKMNENERMELIRILNNIQIKDKNRELASEGKFTDLSYKSYFDALKR